LLLRKYRGLDTGTIQDQPQQLEQSSEVDVMDLFDTGISPFI
jgi:hypothetical protein